jgi:hypothetical protein
MELKERVNLEISLLNDDFSKLDVKERVNLELKQLHTNIAKLEIFIINRLDEVSKYHGRLLKKQVKAMNEYSKILDLRLNDLEEK